MSRTSYLYPGRSISAGITPKWFLKKRRDTEQDMQKTSCSFSHCELQCVSKKLKLESRETYLYYTSYSGGLVMT